MSFWPTRKRYASEPVTGAQIRIATGAFGGGGPVSPYAYVDPNPHTGGIYNFHEGGLFFPGTPSFVFDPGFELPLKSIWGGGGANQGFLIAGDGNSKFSPYQRSPQVYSQQTVKTSGLGGLQAGGIAFQPLLYDVPTPENPMPGGGA